MTSEDLLLALHLIPLELLNTLYMVFASTFVAVAFGLPCGIALFLTQSGGLRQKLPLYRILNVFINIGRSIPFAILMIALIPFTRFIIGTSIGTTAAIVPLSIAAIPLFARLAQTALNEIEGGVIDSSLILGATPLTIVCRVLLLEARISLIAAAVLTFISLVGYSAMAGLVGGGGLGKVAFQYGYQRFNGFLMSLTLLLLLALVESAQWVGDLMMTKYKKQIGRK